MGRAKCEPQKTSFFNSWFLCLKCVLSGILPGTGTPFNRRLWSGDVYPGGPVRIPRVKTDEEITVARETPSDSSILMRWKAR
jgi:hypothetical protein